MPSRPRRIIAGAGLAAGLLVGSIAPAAALPGEPNDSHCDRIERFEGRATDRIDRMEDRVARFESIIDRFEARAAAHAEARPGRADRFERRVTRMQARVDRLEGRIDRITERYNAIAGHCGVDPLGTEPDATEGENPVDDTVKPDVDPGTST